MRIRQIAYLAGVAGVVLLNIFYVDYQFFMMLVLMLAVPAFSLIWYELAKVRLNLYVDAKKQIIALDEKIDIQIRATSAYPVMMPHGSLRIKILYSNTKEFITKEIPVKVCGKHGSGVSICDMPKHCGIVNIYIDTFEVRDFLQIFTKKYRHATVKQIAVFPKRSDLHAAGGYRNGDTLYQLSYSPDDNTEVLDLRPFIEGDAMNHIHWKLSINSEEYIVRQYGSEMEKFSNILVDLTQLPGADFRDMLDRIYEAAWSAACDYLNQGGAVRFIAWDGSSGELAAFAFGSYEDAADAMIGLMGISCSDNAMVKLRNALEHDNKYRGAEQVLITAQDYEQDKGIQVFNVLEDDYESALTAH